MIATKVAPLGVGTAHNDVAYYCDTIAKFLLDNPGDILNYLFSAVPFDDRTIEQDDAWKDEISCLQERLHEIKADGYIVFEYNIIRMAKRIDVVLLLRNVVYSLEFKDGQNTYFAEDMDQALDYALRLKAFHKMSQNLYVCPVLIATKADKSFINPCAIEPDKSIGLQKTNKKELGKIISYIDKKYGSNGSFDFDKWFWSDYNPSPSIVEATVDAFNSVKVADIAHSEAGQAGIDSCEKSVQDVIDYAKKEHKKCICFVTGVPGAGKTLVGLDIAARHAKPKEDLYSVYISGNGPLVRVLQTALADSWLKAGKVKKKGEGLKNAASLIQNGYSFRQACLANPNPPIERILIFDEAQRVWTKAKLDDWSRRKKHLEPHASEPELTIRFMDRHDDWAVIICLVGLGQDIHTGEAGIAGWFDSVLDNHKGWELFYSNDLFEQNVTDQEEKNLVSHYWGSHIVAGLHLAVSVRSFRSEKVSSFVNALVDNNDLATKSTYEEIKENYPIFITRDLALAKKWATYHKIGTQRIGLVTTSTAKDAGDNGVQIPDKRFFDWPKWFLGQDSKIAECSNSLSFAATEFDIQGLEIDWAVVCWGADFRIVDGKFQKFVYKRKWLPVSEYHRGLTTSDDKSRWITNAYRVILTRARQGMVIYVPVGSEGHWDVNYREFYNDTFNYLHNVVGIKELSNENVPGFKASKIMMGPQNTESEAQFLNAEDKLAKLKALSDSKLISEKDYEDKKNIILEKIIFDKDEE
jgi:hypothetical protein